MTDADIVDAGQERGEIATQAENPGNRSAASAYRPRTLAEIGIPEASRLAEARLLRDAYT